MYNFFNFRRLVVLSVVVVFMVVSDARAQDTQISYFVNNLSGNSWQYTYDIRNISLTAGIEEFTIWFDYGLYENLAITTPDPPAGDWDEIVWQPEPLIGDDGGYDGRAEVSTLAIAPGETVSGFAVSFDWLGTGVPGAQFYEIIDPDDFSTLDSGYTVPEPATIFLFGLGVVAIRKRY
ncbi:MAG: PEP-CTERM sorting domain-containing protein [Sedimentisphaerales bacterium]|nr:PEP-CTERM sorting domain-containing protein [Sedimentisphaerales bacterium]